jgi:uncharacterized protein (TIGR02246 family)
MQTTGPGNESAAGLLGAMERAWNEGDSQRFASYFAEDADLVNIHGMRVRGRGSIAGLYDLLFRSVFAHSRLNCQVSRQRQLCEDTALLQLKVEIHVRAGQRSGDHETVSSVVLRRTNQEWEVALLQNTLVAPAVY